MRTGTPWKAAEPSTKKLAGPMPKSLTVTLANLIYFEKAQLPQALANRLIRLAAFQNPEFYKAQAMRMSVWDKPRVIGNAENYPQHIALPRGCLDARWTCCEQRHRLRSERRALRRASRLMCPSSAACAWTRSCGRGNAAPRHRRAVRADRLWQDRDCRRDDCAPGRQHPGAGAPHRTAQAMAGTAAGFSWVSAKV
jgi:hypothetical protein